MDNAHKHSVFTMEPYPKKNKVKLAKLVSLRSMSYWVAIAEKNRIKSNTPKSA